MTMARQSSLLRETYELEFTLREIEPRIWRRVAVRNNHSLAVLHDIIQNVMGWKDCHLHEFEIDGQVYTARYPELEHWEERKVRNERRAYLRDVLSGKGSRFSYLYDQGDYWQHDIAVVKVSQVKTPEELERYPLCLAGERACPPEDVGGSSGYAEMLEALSDPAHEEHESYIDWLGHPFDPEFFDMKAVNSLLRSIR
ncbi:MAG: plasmid pRiA4b ORF-3 family protein [Planctomycetes bacterium]|nr:plasmid pRiA4b ORF-3 family protein [Planctomycetota bacterium]